MIINTSVSKIGGGSPNLQNKTESYTPTETAQTDTITADVGYDGLGTVDVSVGAIPSNYIGSGVPQKSSADLTVSGDTVTAPSGYYSSSASASVASGSATTPATTINPSIFIGVQTNGQIDVTVSKTQSVTPTVTPGYVTSGTAGNITVSGSGSTQLDTQGATTITPTESVQTAVASDIYTTGAITVDAIPSNYVGSGVTQRDSTDLSSTGAVVNVPSGYYASSETYTVPSGSATTPTTAITANPTISVSASGLITSTASASQSVTPTVSAGYVSSGTAGTITVSGSNTSQLATQGATTITPTESVQTAVTAGKYTTGAVSVGAIPSNYVGSGVPQNDSSDLTASGATVTAPSGYYANNATYTVSSGSVVPQATITATGSTITSGMGTITLSKTVSNTPNVTTAGYISSGTAGNSAVSLTANANIQHSAVMYPAQTDRTIPANSWVTGNVVIKASTTATKTITANGTYDPADEDLYGYDVVTVNVPPSAINLQNKTVTPSGSVQSVTADPAYDGLDTVTVNAIPSPWIVPSGTVVIDQQGVYTVDVTQFATASVNIPAPTLFNPTVTPSGSTQTISAPTGYDYIGTVTVDPIPSPWIVPTGSTTITTNGSHDVTNYATAVVDVPATVATKTSSSLSSTSTTLSITGLSAKPAMWALQIVISSGSYVSGATTRYITSALCSGGTTVYSTCLYKSGSTAREYGYNTCTWSWNSNGTITITSPGTSTAGGFRSGSTYRLFYAY